MPSVRFSHQARTDAATGVANTVDYAHHEVHSGSSFSAHLTTDDLDDNPLRISFTTPNTAKWSHAIFVATSSGAASLVVVEAPTGGVVGGSTLTTLNRNRNSANTSTLISTHGTPTAGILTQGATAATGGTELFAVEMGAGKDKIGGESRGTSEWILKQNTTYSVELTSVVNLVKASLELDWYEHTDKE